MTRPHPDPSAPGVPRDAGMSLIEVVVAIALFAVMSSAVLSMVVTAAKVTREDAARIVANNLAMRELEITRDIFSGPTRGPDRLTINKVTNANPLPGGVVGQPYVVDGVAFKVVRDVKYRPIGGAADSACDEAGSSALAYFEVTVEVWWPELGDRDGVRMETIMTPPKGTYSDLNGHIGLKVIDEKGKPVEDVPVRARSTTSAATASGKTSADGCVLLPNLVAGTYTITLNLPGWANPAGDPTAQVTAEVVERQLWRSTVEYAASATISATFATDAGFSVPPGVALPVSVGNSALQPSGSRAIAGTGPTRTLSVWPYPSGYQVWGGNCVANDPGDDRDAPVSSRPGQASSARVYLAPLVVNAPAGVALTAVQARDSSCTSDVNVSLGTVPSAGQLRTSLPYGTWTVRRTSDANKKATVNLRHDYLPGTVTVP